MKKTLFIALLLFGCISAAQSQTTIHGQAEPVELYEISSGGSFLKIITSDIWAYANGDYGYTMPYTLTPSGPPQMDGDPIGDFRPMSCSQAKSDFGANKVKCGPYQVFVESGNVRVPRCLENDNTTCQIKWREDGKDIVVWNPQTN